MQDTSDNPSECRTVVRFPRHSLPDGDSKETMAAHAGAILHDAFPDARIASVNAEFTNGSFPDAVVKILDMAGPYGGEGFMTEVEAVFLTEHEPDPDRLEPILAEIVSFEVVAEEVDDVSHLTGHSPA